MLRRGAAIKPHPVSLEMHALDKHPRLQERLAHGVDRDYPVRRQPKHRVLCLDAEEDAHAVDQPKSPSSQLSRLIGLPNAPVIIDVRTDEDFAGDPAPDARFAPARLPRRQRLGPRHPGHETVVVACQKGLKLSQGVAAWLRHAGIDAQTLEGGLEAWKAAGQPLVRTDKLPARDERMAAPSG